MMVNSSEAVKFFVPLLSYFQHISVLRRSVPTARRWLKGTPPSLMLTVLNHAEYTHSASRYSEAHSSNFCSTSHVTPLAATTRARLILPPKRDRAGKQRPQHASSVGGTFRCTNVPSGAWVLIWRSIRVLSSPLPEHPQSACCPSRYTRSHTFQPPAHVDTHPCHKPVQTRQCSDR